MQPVPEEAGTLAAGPRPSLSRLLPKYAQGNVADRTYALVLGAFGLSIPVLFAVSVLRLGGAAMPAVREFGGSFISSSEWDPVAGQFGALPFIFGTLASSLLALLIAVPLAIGLAIFLTELAPRWLAAPISFGTELLAAIPSVVYGLWGIFVLVPFLRTYIQSPLADSIGDKVGLFRGPAYGSSILAGGVILAIMIVPFISAVSREVLAAVPVTQRE